MEPSAMIWQVTLGDLIQMCGFAIAITAGYYAIKGQLELFKRTLDTHAITLAEHARRMDTAEGRMLDLVSSLQRLIGQSDVRWQDSRKSES